MSFGGGRSSAPPDNSLQVEREKREEREQNRIREEERSARDLENRRNTFNNTLNSAITGFRNTARGNIESRGLNWNQYSGLIERAITNTRGRIADLDPNPGQYFNDDLIDSTLNREQSARRDRNMRAIRQTFQPNAEVSLFADTMDDPFIESVITRQRGEAMTSLDNARRRGNLDDRGYEAALARLGEQERAARAEANTIGSTVLADYRNQLRGVADQAKEAAGGYMLGDNFDAGTYRNRWNSLTQDFNNRLEGDVLGRLSGETFFDLGDIITRGGVAQGAVNPRTGTLDAMAERDRVRNTDRGVGGQGVF